jgi:hypothetical protein
MGRANGFDERLAALEQKLNRRLADLERQVGELKLQVGQTDRKEWWKTIGMFSGNEGMKQIDEAGRKIREADREKARKAAARAGRREAARQTGKTTRRKPA